MRRWARFEVDWARSAADVANSPIRVAAQTLVSVGPKAPALFSEQRDTWTTNSLLDPAGHVVSDAAILGDPESLARADYDIKFSLNAEALRRVASPSGRASRKPGPLPQSPLRHTEITRLPVSNSLRQTRRPAPRDFDLIVIPRRLLHRTVPRLLHGLWERHAGARASVR